LKEERGRGSGKFPHPSSFKVIGQPHKEGKKKVILRRRRECNTRRDVKEGILSRGGEFYFLRSGGKR